jgi:hypothetical protein
LFGWLLIRHWRRPPRGPSSGRRSSHLRIVK